MTAAPFFPDTPPERRSIGIWTEWRGGTRWANEGMVRLLGFLIEGCAISGQYVLRIVLPDDIRDDAEADLRTLDASIGTDFTLHSPRDTGFTARDAAAVAAFSNKHVCVEAWLSLFPQFDGSVFLRAPVTVIFPDANPLVFPTFEERHWGSGGSDVLWRDCVIRALAHADGCITFSQHVAQAALQQLFGYPPERIHVVPHGTPDLKPLLPFLSKRSRDTASRRAAADLLRAYAANRGWLYLADFPFDQCNYIAVSTHDRVTKNVAAAAAAVAHLVRSHRRDVKLFMTAEVHEGESWTALPSLVRRQQPHHDIVSMPDLPRVEHAAFYHCAALAVHPSFFEGGHAPFPFYEAVSVGTPALIARGPHVEELLEDVPDLGPFTFDPYDGAALSDKIAEVLDAREAVHAAQVAIYQKMLARGWAGVAREYIKAALSAAGRPED